MKASTPLGDPQHLLHLSIDGQGTPSVVRGALDSPPDHSCIEGDVLDIRGWCLFEGSSLSRVEVLLGDQSVGDARTYVSSAHIGEIFSHADAPVAAFEAIIPFAPEMLDSTLQVHVRAHSLHGQVWLSDAHNVTTTTEKAIRSRASLRNQHRPGRVVTRDGRERDRILIFTHSLALGGGQLWLTELIRQVLDGIENSIAVVSPEDGPLRELLESWGVAVHITSAWWDVMSPENYEGRVAEQSFLIEEFDAGVVLVNTLGVFSAVDASSRIDVPVLWCIHESFPLPVFAEIAYPNKLSPHVRGRFEECFRLADGLVYEARQTAALFAEMSTGHNEFILDYGVDLAQIDRFRASVDRHETRKRSGFKDEDLIVVVLGVFDPRKAQGEIARAFDELAEVHDDIQLVLVGSTSGAFSEAIKDQVSRLRHSSRVHLIPVGPDYYESLLMADIFLSAADTESLPRSILEAMAFELPIVSTDVYGVASLLKDRSTGWMTGPSDLARLIGVLEVVLRLTDQQRRAVGRAAREAVERRHAGPSYGTLVSSALRDLLTDPASDLNRWFEPVWPPQAKGDELLEQSRGNPEEEEGLMGAKERIAELELLCDRLRRESEHLALAALKDAQEMRRPPNEADSFDATKCLSESPAETIAFLEAEIAAMKATKSWRWTGPPRRVRSWMMGVWN